FVPRLLGMFRHGRGFGGALFVHHALRKFFLDQRHVARQRVGHRLHADLRQIETNFGGGLLIDHALFGFFFRDHLERRLVDRVIFVVLRRKILGLLDIETGFYFGRRRLVVFVVMFLVTVFVERFFIVIVVFFAAFGTFGRIGFVLGREFLFRHRLGAGLDG